MPQRYARRPRVSRMIIMADRMCSKAVAERGGDGGTSYFPKNQPQAEQREYGAKE
jgi:hypothetical protein